jgi:AcrR family transcriptional regulator
MDPPVVPLKLPRGRHNLSRATVLASQRSRLLEAMIEESAYRGYPAITIGHIVERARVARRTFYEHFANKEACFLAAYDYTAEQMLGPLLAAFDPVDDLLARAETYVEAVLEALARRPALARMLVIEVGAGGSAAIDHRLEMHRRIAIGLMDLNARTRAQGVAVPELSESRALAIVGALVELIHAGIQDRGAERLTELRDDFAAVVAALLAPDVR